MVLMGIPQWLNDKESACNAGDAAGASGSIPGWESSPREEKGNPLQYACLGNPMDCGLPGSSVAKNQHGQHGWPTEQQQRYYWNSCLFICFLLKHGPTFKKLTLFRVRGKQYFNMKQLQNQNVPECATRMWYEWQFLKGIQTEEKAS